MNRAIARNFVRLAGVLLVASLAAAPAWADGTWSGGAGSPWKWSVGGNWSAGSASGNVTFATSTGLSNNNDINSLSLSSITFASNAGAFILGGNQFTLNGNITVQNTGTTETINNDIVLGNNNIGYVGSANGSNLLTLAGGISDNNSGYGITVGKGGGFSGPAYLTLAGANTFSGNMTISGGSPSQGMSAFLILANPLALQNSTLVQGGTAAIAYLQFGTLAQATFGGLSTPSGAATITLTNTNNAAVALSVGNYNTNTTAAGVIAGLGSLTKIGNGTLILAGANTYAGTSIISAGTLQVGAGSTTGQLGTGAYVTDNASLVINRSNAYTYSGAISGTGTVTQSGPGTLVLSGSNSYNGGTTISGGFLQFGTAGTIPTGNPVPSSGSITINGGGALVATGTATPVTDWLNSTKIVTSSTGAIAILGGSSENINFSGYNSLYLCATSGGSTYSGTALTPAGGAYRFGGPAATLTVTSTLNNTSGSTALIAGASGGPSGGMVVLSGSNGYSGGTTLNAGTLSVSADVNLGNGNGGITFSGGILQVTGTTLNNLDARSNYSAGNVNWSTFRGGFDITNAGNTFTVSQSIQGAGTLSKLGSGTLVLSGSNTYGGLTTISTGTLQIGTGGTTGTLGTGSVTDNASLVFYRSNTVTYSGVISGTGTVTQLGLGTLILANNNTYTGTSIISAGTLQFGTGGTTGSTAGNFTDNASLVFNRSDTAAYSGVISGTGSLTQAGLGTLVLSGSNTFTGLTTITSGTALLGNALALQNSTLDISGAGMASFGTFTAATLGGLQGASGALSLLNTSSKAVALSVGNNNFSTTCSGVLGGSGSLIKIGAGTLALAGTNTFGGGLTLSAGQLNINNAAALGTGTFTVGTATIIDNASGAAITSTTNNAQNWNGDFTFAGSGGAASNLDLGTGAVTFGASRTVTVNGGTLTVGGVISGGAYGLTKAGSGTLALANTQNSYSGGTVLTAGELSVSSNGCIPAGTVVFAGGTLQITGTSMTNFNAYNAYVQWGTFGNGLDIADPNNTFSVNQIISGGGSLTKSGSGTLVLYGVYSTYTGGTFVTAGTLQLGNSSGNGSAGGTGNGQGDGGAVALSLGTTLAFANPLPQTQAGVISGSGNLVKMGTGTLTLTGSNTYTGGTLLATGTLSIAADSNIGGSTAALTFAGGTLQVTGTGLTSLDGHAVNWETFNGGLDIATANTFTVTQALGGGGRLTKAGGGTLVVSGSMSTYTGGTFVTAGTLQVGDGSAHNGSLGGADTQSGSATVSAGATLAFANSTAQTYSGVVSGSGDVVKSGTGMLVLSGSNTFTGATTVTSNGGITLGNALALQNSTIDYGGFGGILSFGTLTEATLGGLQGTNFYIPDGDPAVDTRLSLSDSVGAVALTVGNNSESTTFSGAIIGSGSLIKVGAGTLTLSGTNTYSGGTTVAGGTLDISTLESLPSGTTLTMAGSAAVVFANDLGGAIELDLLSIDLSGASGSPMYTFEVFSKGTVSGQAPTSEVPEPGTLVLLAAGAVAVLAWRRRKKGLGIGD